MDIEEEEFDDEQIDDQAERDGWNEVIDNVGEFEDEEVDEEVDEEEDHAEDEERDTDDEVEGFDKEIVSDIDDEEVPQIDFGYDKNGDPQQLESPALQRIDVGIVLDELLETIEESHKERIRVIDETRSKKEENIPRIPIELEVKTAVSSHLQSIRKEMVEQEKHEIKKLYEEFLLRTEVMDRAIKLCDEDPVNFQRELKFFRDEQNRIKKIVSSRKYKIETEEERRKDLRLVGNRIYNLFTELERDKRMLSNQPPGAEERESPSNDREELRNWLSLMLAQHEVLLIRTDECEETFDIKHHRMIQQRIKKNLEEMLAVENEFDNDLNFKLFRRLLIEEEKTQFSRTILYNEIMQQNHRDGDVLFGEITNTLKKILHQIHHEVLGFEEYYSEKHPEKDEQKDEDLKNEPAARSEDPQDSREDVGNEPSSSNSASNIGDQTGEASQEPPQRSLKRGNQDEMPVAKRTRQ